MLALLRRIVRAGVDHARPEDAKYVVVTNALVVITIPALVALATLFYWATSLPLPLAALVFASGALGYALVPVLNAARRYDAALIVAGSNATAVLVVPTLLIGTAGASHIYMGLTVMGAWLAIPPTRRGAAWAFSILNLVGLVALQILFRHATPPYPVHASWVLTLTMINLGTFTAMLMVFGVYAHFTMTAADARLAREQQRSESLLRNILPDAVIDRLKAGATIADRFESATVLFADLANFTQRAERVAPEQLVAMLHDIFTRFDALCDGFGLEKIKTIGDAYMVVGGVPTARPDHAEAVADLALAMIAELAQAQDGFADTAAPRLELRIGIHTGPVVAGVIGQRKFAYDLWGDTVNTASRMESHGEPGRIQTTEPVYQALHARFDFEPRGAIPVKGKGELAAYFLLGRRAG